VRRAALAAAASALALAAAGCGGDDEESAATTEAAPPPTAEPAPTETQPQTEREAEAEEGETEQETERKAEAEARDPTEPPEPPEWPEDQPGGAGDEEPARSLALLTGENGVIRPRVVRVPAFISIRVELRSADGREYALRFKGETIRVSSALASVSTTFDGLRPGASMVGTPAGGGAKVRIEATAEPGP
jgi:hypothetical protein